MAFQPRCDDGQDPLERRYAARAVVLLALVAGGVASLLGSGGEFHDGLPGIALGSPFLLHAERALVVAAGIAAFLVFSVRGWAGYFPSKISTGGAEYLRRPAVDEAFEGGAGLHDELRRLTSIQLRLARNTQLRLDEIERDIASMKAGRARERVADDML